MSKRRLRAIQITIKREHGGLYWMDQEEFEKIAPHLEPDSSEEFFVTIHASNAVTSSTTTGENNKKEVDQK